MISEILPVFARKPIFGYKAIAAATVAIAFLGLLVWAHHMFTTPTATVVLAFFMLSSFTIAVPTGIKIFNWIATLWRGSIVFKTPLYFAAALPALFVIGGISGIQLAIFPVDWQLHDSYFVVAHFHYTIFGGGVFGYFAGLYYWFPKMTGRMMSESLGKWSFWLMFIGFNVTFLIQHSAGLSGMPARTTTATSSGWRSTTRSRRSARSCSAWAWCSRSSTSSSACARARRAATTRGRAIRSSGSRARPAAQQLRRDPARPQRGADAGHPPRGGGRGRCEGDLAQPVASRGVNAAPAIGFRRLVLATLVATFALIVLGGIVRVSDSGLGCGPAGSGFHGWPFCNGDVVPGLDLNTIIEYAHRVLAMVGLMILSLFVLAWRRYREYRLATGALLVLVAVQGLLGGATVEENLEEAYVAAHLGLAMLLVGVELYLFRSVRGVRSEDGGPRIRLLAIAATAAVFCTIVAGGYMAGTQTTGARTISSGRAPTMPAASSSPPATASSCPSAGPSSWTSTSPTAPSCTWPRSS